MSTSGQAYNEVLPFEIALILLHHVALSRPIDCVNASLGESATVMPAPIKAEDDSTALIAIDPLQVSAPVETTSVQAVPV